MKKTIIVGGTLRDAAARVAETWHRAERGEPLEPQDTITFQNWSALAAVMTERRYELLRHLHDQSAPSIRALARDLGRDFKRVHEDVSALESIGLIERDAAGNLCVGYEAIHTTIAVAPRAA